MDFQQARTRLYRLSVTLNALVLPGFLTAIAVFGETTGPIAQWPSEFARFFTPGLPANLIEAGLKFPVQTILIALVIGATYWMNRVVKLEDGEHAFQTWLRGPAPLLGMAPPAPPPGPVPPPAPCARIVAGIARFWWLLPVLVLMALPLTTFSDTPKAHSTQGETFGASPERESPCIVACGLRTLGHGETVQVTVAAKRKRNETGLLLARDRTYTARFITSDGWCDGDYVASASGVRFEGGVRYLAKAAEWLRPYPGGDWFQLIGRIERGRDVFPILDQRAPGKPFAFRAPEDGELVLLVNDVIYTNNRGFLTLEIRADPEP